MVRLFKELLIFAVILVILAFIQHQDLLTEPLKRWDMLMNKVNGTSIEHPFYWTLGAYMVLGAGRLIIVGITSFFEASKGSGK